MDASICGRVAARTRCAARASSPGGPPARGHIPPPAPALRPRERSDAVSSACVPGARRLRRRNGKAAARTHTRHACAAARSRCGKRRHHAARGGDDVAGEEQLCGVWALALLAFSTQLLHAAAATRLLHAAAATRETRYPCAHAPAPACSACLHRWYWRLELGRPQRVRCGSRGVAARRTRGNATLRACCSRRASCVLLTCLLRARSYWGKEYDRDASKAAFDVLAANGLTFIDTAEASATEGRAATRRALAAAAAAAARCRCAHYTYAWLMPLAAAPAGVRLWAERRVYRRVRAVISVARVVPDCKQDGAAAVAPLLRLGGGRLPRLAQAPGHAEGTGCCAACLTTPRLCDMRCECA
jgi:hypothetical protein